MTKEIEAPGATNKVSEVKNIVRSLIESAIVGVCTSAIIGYGTVQVLSANFANISKQQAAFEDRAAKTSEITMLQLRSLETVVASHSAQLSSLSTAQTYNKEQYQSLTERQQRISDQISALQTSLTAGQRR